MKTKVRKIKTDLATKIQTWVPGQYYLENDSFGVLDSTRMTVKEIKEKIKIHGNKNVINNVKTGILYSIVPLYQRDTKTWQYVISILAENKYPTGLVSVNDLKIGHITQGDLYKIFNDARTFAVLKDKDGLFKGVNYGEGYIGFDKE